MRGVTRCAVLLLALLQPSSAMFFINHHRAPIMMHQPASYCSANARRCTVRPRLLGPDKIIRNGKGCQLHDQWHIPCEKSHPKASSYSVSIDQNRKITVKSTIAGTSIKTMYSSLSNVLPEKITGATTNGVPVANPPRERETRYQRTVPVSVAKSGAGSRPSNVRHVSMIEETVGGGEKSADASAAKTSTIQHQIQSQVTQHQVQKAGNQAQMNENEDHTHQRMNPQQRQQEQCNKEKQQARDKHQDQYQQRRPVQQEQQQKHMKQERPSPSDASAAAPNNRRAHQPASKERLPSSPQTRKDYVRAKPPGRECTGRYCRQHWQHTHPPAKAAARTSSHNDGDADVVFVGDGASTTENASEMLPAGSVDAILSKQGPLDVEAYIRAIEADIAHIRAASVV